MPSVEAPAAPSPAGPDPHPLLKATTPLTAIGGDRSPDAVPADIAGLKPALPADIAGLKPALPADIAGLEPGLLVFCARPSPIQSCSQVVGDEWRHAGLVVETADGLFVSGFGRRDKYALMPVANLARYSRVGVASVFTDRSEIERMHRWVAQFENRPATYPWSSILAALLLSFGRLLRSSLLRRGIVAICALYCLVLSLRLRRRTAFICSTFVVAAVNSVRRKPLRLNMLSQKFSPASSRPSETEGLLERWLATPSDIWRAIPPAHRRDLHIAA